MTKKREFPFSVDFYNFAAKYSYALLLHRPLHLKKYSNILSYMKKDCADVLEKHRNESSELTGSIPGHLWVLWWQGADKLPPIVSECVERMSNIEGYELTILDKDNISSYIDLSDMLPLLESGELKIQFMSDVIRMRILRKHGGFWVDATLAILDRKFLDDIVAGYQFYSIRLENFQEWWNVSGARWSAYFWATVPGNPFFAYMDDCFTYFALKHKRIIDYFQIDFTVRLAYEEFAWARKLIDAFPYYRHDMFFLDKVMNRPLADKYRAKMDSDPVYKLNWRKEVKSLDGRETCWEYARRRLVN